MVGASSGLGRSIAVGLGARGDRVALVARRGDRLERAAAEAGPDAVALAADVSDEDDVRAAVAAAIEQLGGLDGLVYAAGVGPLAMLADTDAATWRRTLDVNVVGAALVTAATIGPLTAAGGSAVYLSSVSASLTPPWPGLGAYGVSKTALDALVEAWRGEHPAVGFVRLTVGDCAGGPGEAATGFADGWDPDLAARLFPAWLDAGLMDGALLDVDQLVAVVDHALHDPAAVGPTAAVTPSTRPNSRSCGTSQGS